MRVSNLAIPALLLLGAACGKAPQVTVNVQPDTTTNVTFTSAYDLDEGSALDLVIDPGKSGAVVTASTLPMHASLADGIFSFTPDYTQAGLYSVTFTITATNSVTTRVIAFRVLNVIHATAPSAPGMMPTAVEGGVGITTVTSNDLPGTVVSYSTDTPEATIDSFTGELKFRPDFRWLDTKSAFAVVNVTASGQEVDTGKQRSTTTGVVFNVTEGTSFSQELVPLFFIPAATTDVSKHQGPEGHNCSSCHNGDSMAPAAMDFTTADAIYNALVTDGLYTVVDPNHAQSCAAEVANGRKRVAPKDLANSVWFWKVSGTDGAGNPGPGCGDQMPQSQKYNWWTTTDLDAWYACTTSACREDLLCKDTDVTCKLKSRLVAKAAAWIMAGAPNN